MGNGSNKELGLKGEDDAVLFLKKNGYKILQKNYSCNLGEIDIIALKKKILVFVEVKVRSTDRFGSAEYAITKQKRRQIVRTAETYLFRNNINNVDCRFDVVAINYNVDNSSPPEFKLLENAFQLDDI